MQTQRAYEPVEFTAPVEPSRPQPKLADGDADAGFLSPVIQMREELAARLSGAELSGPSGAIAAPVSPKMPVAMRLAIIAGLGAACWTAIGLSLALTI